MNAVAKPQMTRGQGQRTWTAAQREEQSRRLKSRQIWLKSTGPRTEAGKFVSSKNARHPDYDQRQEQRTELRHICTYLRTQRSYSKLLNLFLKQEHSLSVTKHNAYIDALFFLENELIDIERQMFDGMTFYEVTGYNARLKKGNIIPFPSCNLSEK